jgi:alpha-tubulin suppressor-like RCC1 family protein
VSGLKDAVEIATAGKAMCARRKTGEIWCFPTSALPPPGATRADMPLITAQPVEGIADVTSLAGGPGGLCAVKKDATLWCWGSNENGELGQGDLAYANTPLRVPGLEGVVEAAMGWGHVCATKKSGEVLCWGKSHTDQTGQPAPPFAFSPVPVLLPPAPP